MTQLVKVLPPTSGKSLIHAYSRLWRKTLHELDFSPIKFDMWMKRYLSKDPEMSESEDALTKLFSSSNMSLKTFCLAMRFLDVKDFKITVTLNHSTGVSTNHSIMVDAENSVLK